MVNPRVGLLPLYLELYDNAMPDCRPRMDAFAETIAHELRCKDLDVALAPVCRIEAEFGNAVKMLEEARVDAIVTLHLAYSPSLESAAALARTNLPIIVLDTTPTYGYGPTQDPAELMYNHGIHGVQDMCNLLIRNGKPFYIEAGHWQNSDVLDRVAEWAKAAQAASMMRNARVGLVGDPFKGMGDFAVPTDVLESTIGPKTIAITLEELSKFLPDASDKDVQTEIAENLSIFDVNCISDESHMNSARAGLALRKWIEKKKLTAFTMNFGSFSGNKSIPTVPFLEASKSMACGIGYAGEGDVLTASLVGALASMWPETTFTEMFCADWESESIYLSHMGEFNINLADGKAQLLDKNLAFLETGSMAMAVGRLKPGSAVLVNLAPGPDNTYTLILAPIEMLGVDGEDRMQESIRGWFRPLMPIADFLTEYSYAGGTHHSALVYGDVGEILARFGDIMGWDVVVLS
ncbi:MAG: L-arabinose isomerase family protein [Armatimonadota bacterium]